MQITLVFFLLSRILVHSFTSYFQLFLSICALLHSTSLRCADHKKYNIKKLKKVHRVLEQFTVTARGTFKIIYTISSSSSTSFSFYDSLYSTLVSTLLFFFYQFHPVLGYSCFFPLLYSLSQLIWSMWLTHQSILISQTRECGQKVAQSEFLSLWLLACCATHHFLLLSDFTCGRSFGG